MSRKAARAAVEFNPTISRRARVPEETRKLISVGRFQKIGIERMVELTIRDSE